MARPGLRPMHRLPLLEARRDALERCVYCPKLCRSACPVSNAEPRETLTPWGKMSMASFVAHGDVALEPSFAAPAWACTGCYACRDACDHKNEVAPTLFDARAELLARGVAPGAASRAVRAFDAHEAALARDVRTLLATRDGHAEDARGANDRGDASPPLGPSTASSTALLIGCGYVRKAPDVARDITQATASLVGPVRVLDACCGLPLLHAGDREGFRVRAERMRDAIGSAERVVVADPGCALALAVRYADVGVALPSRIELLITLAARELGRLPALAPEARPRGASDDAAAVRYHDPCQLGRGFGIYEPPRALLSRFLGRAPDEFDARRGEAHCSGAGSLLPVTMPHTSSAIADARLAEHEREGGGHVVTACASSLRALAKQGASVSDLHTWIARAVLQERPNAPSGEPPSGRPSDPTEPSASAP